MKSPKIKILIADDSGLMRLLINQMLSEDERIEVVDTASDGKEAYEKTLVHKPDVILLDLIMSPYDGLYAIRHIMQEIPTSILIISSLERNQSNLVLNAMKLGAFDFIAKPTGAFNSKVREIKDILLAKIFEASSTNPNILLKKDLKINNHHHTFSSSHRYEAIVIGASTGGTNAIENILLNLPANLPIPLLIVQHIPQDFGQSFAARLNLEMSFQVKVPHNAEIVQNGIVYIAPSDYNLHLTKSNDSTIAFHYTNTQYPEYNFPSINALMCSANEVYQGKIIAVVLTGMGKDGTMGLDKIYHAGGLTIAQDKESSVVFGMPRSAIEAGFIHHVLSLKEIPGFLVNALEV